MVLWALALTACPSERVRDVTIDREHEDVRFAQHEDSQTKVPAPADPGADRVLGELVPRAGSWWVDGPRIRRGADIVRFSGVNWFGLETPERALHGLWTGRTLAELMANVAALGFNALRLPISPEVIRPGLPCNPWAVVDDGDGDPIDTGRENLVAALAAAEHAGLFVILDFHSCGSDPALRHVGRPDACDGYTLASWQGDLAELARIAARFPNVAGIDIFNEPHGLTWSEWKTIAADGAAAVLAANPRLLVLIQGVGGGASVDQVVGTFWGEDLTQALIDPFDTLLVPASRLVFSPHVYGPGVARQSYFDDPAFPANLPAIWDRHFGFLRHADRAVVVGEFGGWNDDAKAPGEVAWNTTFVAYLASWDRPSYFYWSLNPNSADTGGIFGDDWKTVETGRIKLLRPLLEPSPPKKP